MISTMSTKKLFWRDSLELIQNSEPPIITPPVWLQSVVDAVAKVAKLILPPWSNEGGEGLVTFILHRTEGHQDFPISKINFMCESRYMSFNVAIEVH